MRSRVECERDPETSIVSLAANNNNNKKKKHIAAHRAHNGRLIGWGCLMSQVSVVLRKPNAEILVGERPAPCLPTIVSIARGPPECNAAFKACCLGHFLRGRLFFLGAILHTHTLRCDVTRSEKEGCYFCNTRGFFFLFRARCRHGGRRENVLGHVVEAYLQQLFR